MIDLPPFDEELSGREAESALDAAGISVTACALGADSRLPGDTSAIRLGTAALTTAGMRAEHMGAVADLILRALFSRGDPDQIARVRAEVAELCAAFPPYGDVS